MKKTALYALACVLSLSFFSCSTESNDVTTDNATTTTFQLKSVPKIDLATAKQLYINMMGTQDYADYKNALSAFTDKLLLNKITGTTKNEWMTWIGSNLNKTGFSSVAEFESMYDSCTNKLSKMMTANSDLYDFIATADLTQVGAVLEPEYANHTVNYPTAADSCTDDCIDTCDAELDALESQYAQNLQYAAMSGSFEYGMAADANYENTYIEIALSFNACVGSC